MGQRVRIVDGPYVTVVGSTGSEYRVYALGTPQQYCTCPAWKFQRKGTYDPAQGRECKHIRSLLAASVRVPVAEGYQPRTAAGVGA